MISIVKAEGRQTSQPPIKSEDSNITTVSSTESKTEFIPNPEIRAPGTCHSGMKLEFKQSTNEQDSMRVLDSSIREVTGLEPAPSSSSARSLTILPDDQIASGSQTAADDILTLTDDLRPKAIVPDLSESAAAEVNVVATTDHPIEVSESEEDAIVFLRQNIFTPPLVDLESGSENDGESILLIFRSLEFELSVLVLSIFDHASRIHFFSNSHLSAEIVCVTSLLLSEA